jgi:superfamily II DNA or RNA helicase
LYSEARDTIGVPRGFFAEKNTGGHDEVLRVTDGAPMNGVKSVLRFDGPFAEQAKAIEKMIEYTDKRDWGGFLLKAGCGFGKTNTALEFAHRVGSRTLILVHKEFFLRQWRDRIEEFYPGAVVGTIRQDRCDYVGCDFVIGMLQSLARDDGEGSKYPVEMYRSFGLIISDECHRIAAQTWSDILPRFSARWRLGLTATPRRKDDAEDVFFGHIGQILYSAKTMPVVPKIRKMYTDARLMPQRVGRKIVQPERLKHSQILSQLIDDSARTRMIVDDVAEAVSRGRKVMVISERLQHLKSLHGALMSVLFRLDLPFEPVVDFYTGEWFVPGQTKNGKQKRRTRTEAELNQAARANVVFATKQMVEEGLDVQALDVLVLATPLSDVEQAVGRIRRNCKPAKTKCEYLCPWRAGKCGGKPGPIVVDVIDGRIEQAKRKYARRLGFYRSIGSL